MNWKALLALLLAAVLLNACSSSKPASESGTSNEAKKPEVKPADNESGRVVFQRLYTTSRGWAPDTQPISLQSENFKRSDNAQQASLGHDGKSATWRGVFGSASRHLMKTYMWSGLTGPDASPGITPGPEDSFSASNSSTQPFDLVYLKKDSDDAFAVAQKHGGEAQLKKSPELPVNYSLAWEPRKSMLVWHVMYGQSINEPALDVVVNATTGQFVRVEK